MRLKRIKLEHSGKIQNEEMPHTGTCTELNEWKDDSDNTKLTEKRIVVKTSLQTLLKRKATGEKATELEPETNTLLRSFSHTSHRSQPQIRLPSLYVSVVGVPLYSDRSKIYASRLVQCVMVMGSAGDSV